MNEPSSFRTRRHFLLTASAFTAIATHPAFAMQQVPDAGPRLSRDPERPQFHLLPARNWMNDPNGPIYFNGNYHMFFQYNPTAAVWGDMSWNHAVSPDMLHWKHLPIALEPTPGGDDAYGVFSGSALQVGKRVYALYTATRRSTPELATLKDGGPPIQESQALAWSDSPDLRHWTRDPQPVVPLPPPGMRVTGFRDPSVWKDGEWYYMTVGSGTADVGGCVLLYRSHDLKTWAYLHTLADGTWDGKKTANPVDDGEMWECPELFALDGGHVLIYSTQGKVFWQSGMLDRASMKFAAAKTGLLDLDAFYAPKTQLDAKGQRILWGWIPERRPDAALRKAGWAGMMSLPRVLRLNGDGTLRMEVLPQTAALRGRALSTTRSASSLVLPGCNGEMKYSGAKGTAYTLEISRGQTSLVSVQYLPEKHAFIADGKQVLLDQDDKPELHAFADGSVLELILAQRIGYTKRFYYSENEAPDLVVSVSPLQELQAWAIHPVSSNRLTTPATV